MKSYNLLREVILLRWTEVSPKGGGCITSDNSVNSELAYFIDTALLCASLSFIIASGW